MEAREKYEAEIMEIVRLLPEEQLPGVVSMLDKMKQDKAVRKQEYLEAIKELRGKYKNELSSTEAFMQRKQEEKELDL